MALSLIVRVLGPSLPKLAEGLEAGAADTVRRVEREAPKDARRSLLDAIRHLRRSGELERSLEDVRGGAGLTAPYAARLDRGGTQTARARSRITVPIAGHRAPPRGSGRLSLIPTPKGGVLARVRGRAVTPLFALRTTVQHRARPYVDRAGDDFAKRIEAGAGNKVEASVDASIVDAVKEGVRR